MRVTLVCAAALLSCKPTPLSYLSPPGGSDTRAGVGSLGLQIQRAFEGEYTQQLDRPPAPPVRLVPTDGSELGLKTLEASVTIRGPLAHTELKFVFHNAENRTREGRFAIDLPPGAAVGRFAMVVDNKWREARIVARHRAREVYETFLHRKVDPALLEQDMGNRFSARIFPIFGKTDKEIILGYDHVVSDGDPYTLALSGLPAVPRLTVRIDHNGAVTALDRSGVVPDDVVLPIAPGNGMVEAGAAFVARITTDAHASPSPLERLLILVDTSASRATVMGTQLDFVRRLVAALPPATEVTIAAFDHAVSELHRGPASTAGAGALKLAEHGALGGSNLGAALARAAAMGIPRVLVIGDGMPTLGETDAKQLRALVESSPIARIDAVRLGASIDRDTLQAIVGAGDEPGAILDGRDPARVARQLQLSLGTELPITVAGATGVWPPTTRGILPGDPVFVSGLRTGTAPLSVKLGSRGVTLTGVLGLPRHTRRAVARAEVAHLMEQVRTTPADSPDRKTLEKRILDVALAHELVSSQTSLLVLETDNDELRMLGKRTPNNQPEPVVGASAGGGEMIMITSQAPIIDQSSTTQGVTISRSYVSVLSRTFGEALMVVPGAQSDGYGVSFSGSSSLENVYYVDGVNTTPIGSVGQRRIFVSSGSGLLPFIPSPRPSWSEPDNRHKLRRGKSPYVGALHQTMELLRASQREEASAVAARAQLANPGDLAAIIALGEAAEARGAVGIAARAYGSIADLYPNRAELLRAAGERLDRIGARELAIDVYRRAVRERGDHPTGYRLLAWAQFRANDADAAFETLREGLVQASFGLAVTVLQRDLQLVAAHLAARDPGRRAELLAKAGVIPVKPALHVVLTWETDANDVDLHVWDRKNNHVFESKRAWDHGGIDQRDGWGPEMFHLEDPKGFPYTIAAHYFDRGPMGIGLGTVQVIRHDGKGNITVDDRPFLIQKDRATVELGVIR